MALKFGRLGSESNPYNTTGVRHGSIWSAGSHASGYGAPQVPRDSGPGRNLTPGYVGDRDVWSAGIRSGPQPSGAGPSKLGPTPRFTQRTSIRPGLSSTFYGGRTREGNLQTGFGSTRPKLLSFRRFTSRWLSPSQPGRPAFGGLTQNPLYGGGGGESFGRGPGFGGTYSFGQRTGQMGFRQTV